MRTTVNGKLCRLPLETLSKPCNCCLDCGRANDDHEEESPAAAQRRLHTRPPAAWVSRGKDTIVRFFLINNSAVNTTCSANV